MNKEWVRVYLQPAGLAGGGHADQSAPTPQAFNSPLSGSGAAPLASSGSNEAIYWFEIGAVDTFERSLRELEANMGVEPINRVPVNYKSQLRAYACDYKYLNAPQIAFL